MNQLKSLFSSKSMGWRRRSSNWIIASRGKRQSSSFSQAPFKSELEDILAYFNAPVRFAFGYGSGVYPQNGYDVKSSRKDQEEVVHTVHICITSPAIIIIIYIYTYIYSFPSIFACK